MILLIAYGLLFILSGGFRGLSENGPGNIGLNYATYSEWFPIQIIKESLGLIQFHQYMDPNFTSEDASRMLMWQLAFLKDLGRVFLAYVPIAFGIVILHKKFLKGLGIAVLLESLLYIQTDMDFIGVSVVFSVVSFGMVFLLNRIILKRFSRREERAVTHSIVNTKVEADDIIRLNEINEIKSPKTKVLIISMLLMCLFLVGHVETQDTYSGYLADTKYTTNDLVLSDQGLILQKPEITRYDEFIRIDGYLEDHIPFELPYEVARKDYHLKYKCGDLELETIGSRNMRFSVRLDVYDPRDPFVPNAPKLNLALYPLEIEGISQIMYRIEDPKLLDQFEVIDENWTEIVPYPIYEMTYRVPKFEGYTASWYRFQNLNLKSGIIKKGRNTMHPSYWDEVQTIDEGSTLKITVRYAYYDVNFDEIESADFTVESVELVKDLGEVSGDPVLVIEDKSYFN
ncbi:hypothetical protein [Fusibacter sp. 3D3]|uniref:hypothetical protein n=1 Tax=Fusibacter sp. 3D3 TaxID=1048380 RepID=UPI001112E586|nr:hypothetical protein [Fusibacter sp. 3D3]